MGKQLERFVKAVVGDILKWDYPYLTSPAILLARVSAVKTLSDTYEAEELDIAIHDEVANYRSHGVSRWKEDTLTVVDRFGSEDSNFPALPGVRSKIQLQAGALAAIALPFGDLTPVIIGEVVL